MCTSFVRWDGCIVNTKCFKPWKVHEKPELKHTPSLILYSTFLICKCDESCWKWAKPHRDTLQMMPSGDRSWSWFTESTRHNKTWGSLNDALIFVNIWKNRLMYLHVSTLETVKSEDEWQPAKYCVITLYTSRGTILALFFCFFYAEKVALEVKM